MKKEEHMKVRILFSLLMVLGATFTALAQCKEIKWPEDRKKAEECVAIWGDALKQGGNFKVAVGPIQWMLKNAPQWNVKLYIDGTNLYDKLAEGEKEAARKKVLVDSLLLIYDLRIKNCGDEVNVLNRKAYASYKYNLKDKEALPALLALYDKVYEISGYDVFDANLVAYMNVMKANKLYLKNMTDDQILERYDKVSDVVDHNIANAKNAAETEKQRQYKEAIDQILISMVKVDCEFVKKNLEPKFRQKPNDLALAKKIFKFMLDGNCIDDPLWIDAGETIHKLNPQKDFGLLKALAAANIAKGDYNRAESLLKEAANIPNMTTKEKAEADSYMGSIEAKKKNYSAAREYFRKAVANDPNDKDSWEKIGDLYYNSFDECAKRQNMAEDRLVYLAAYDMYAKSGNSAAMARAKAQFPSKEEIFLLNWQAGSTQRVGCWIQETVVIKTRD